MAKMRGVLLILPFCSVALTAPGQVVNGSFEDENGSSLEGWTFSSGGDVDPHNDGAPGSGAWSAAPHASQSSSTGLHWIAQQVGPLMAGDIYTVSFWVKCPMQYEQCVCLHLNGPTNPTICANTPDWSLVTFTDTSGVAGELEILFRAKSTGLTGNYNPRPGYIDGVSFELNGHVGVNEIAGARDPFRFDPDNRTLLFRPERDVQVLRICDASGRSVLSLGPVRAGQESTYRLQELPVGLYVAIAESEDEHQTFKLFLR